MTSFFNFFNNRSQQKRNQAKRGALARSPLKPRRLMTETLEDRRLLAVDVLGGVSAAFADTANIIDISSDDASIASIKQAIAEAAASPEDDVIQISASTLKFASASDEITIDVNSSEYGSITLVAVDGDVTIDANSLARAFSVKNGDVVLQGFNIVNGVADYGGAIANDGDLTLVGVTLSNNQATVSGGAIANSGSLAVQDSVITDNSSNGSGGAIYEGDFSWPTADAPEWTTIPDQTGSKGTTISVDLSDYINAGDWTYSYKIASTTSVILLTEPMLSDSGVLSFTFIGDEQFYGEDDYSAINVTVTATDGVNSDSTTFTVTLAEQTSVTLAAILSNMTYEDACAEYEQVFKNKVIGYCRDEGIPEPSVVDVAEPTTIQIWIQDFDYSSNEDKIWDAGDNYFIMGIEYRLHLENAKITEFTGDTDLKRAAFRPRLLDNGDYEFIVAYTSDPGFGYEEALLLDVLTIEAIDPSQPVSATIYQLNQNFTFPVYTRFYNEPNPRDFARNHVNVDPSQTLFLSTISNSTDPLSAIPGEPFDRDTFPSTYIDPNEYPYVSGAKLDKAAVGFSNASLGASKSLTISNSLIANNAADGSGAVYIASDGTATFYNYTLADNTASTGAIVYAGSTAGAVSIANSIVVNDGLKPVSGVADVTGSLFNASAPGAIEYSGGALFNDASNGDYSLVYGSEAMNIGSDAYALDVNGIALARDLAGASRIVGRVDAGAYEYQGSAPARPASLAVSDYVESEKNPSLSWTASSSADVDGYYIYYNDGTTLTLIAEVDSSTTTYANLADAIIFEDNASYTFSVSAFNAFGESAKATVTLSTGVVPAAPSDLTFGDYADGSVTLSWTAGQGATSYNVELLGPGGEWTILGTTADTTYTVTDLNDFTTYTFRVTSVNTSGTASSDAVEFATVGSLSAPTGFKQSGAYTGDGNITLEWNAVDNARGYAIRQKIDGVWTTLSFVANPTYTVSDLSDNTAYEFSVAAYAKDSDGNVYYSDYTELSLTTTIAPAAPENVAWATEYDGSGSAELTWDAVDGAYAYSIARYVDGSWSEFIRTVDLSYTIDGLANNAEYVFGVAAYTVSGSTKYYSDYTRIDLTTTVAPDAPTNVAFETGEDGTSATLVWNPVEYADGYLIEQQFGDEWISVATLDAEASSWIPSGLEENTTYTFRISAFNEAGSSDFVEASLTTGVAVAPEAPTDFQIVGYNAETRRATMTWADNAANEHGYEVQYSYDGTTWHTAAMLEADSTSRVATGLTPGVTYYFRVAAFNTAGYSDWAQVSFETPAEVPSAPTDVVFSDYDADAQTVVVSWTDNSDDEINFRVQYSLDQTNWYTSANTDPGVTSYTATGLVPGRTYYYRVAAVGLYGISDWATGSYTVETVSPDLPAAPSDIEFSGVEFTDSGVIATMSWTDNSDNEDRFVVQFSYDNENWYGAGTTDANVSTRTATGLVAGRTYFFRVAAYNDAGYSDWTHATFTVPTPTIDAPSDIVFGEYSNGEVPMSWTDNSDDERGFIVQFSYDGVNWHRGGMTEANVTSRVATSMTPGRLYYFRVAAYNDLGYSDWVTGQYMTPSGAPVAPGEITFSNYDASNRTVDMAWVDNSADETGFNIQYSIDGGDTWFASGNTSADVNYRTATGLRVGVTYEFRVRSFNAYGSSGWTTGSFTVPISENAPAAPTDFVYGEYDADARTLGMSWTDNATNETGYKVQYSIDGGATWYAAGNYGADVTSRTATSVNAGRTYMFRVAAYNADGTSAWLVSDPYEVSPSVHIPAAPSEVTFSDYDPEAQTVIMSWTDNSSNEKGFKVEYSVDGGTTWNDSAYLEANATSRTVTKLVPGRDYSFRVAAYNNYGYSDWTFGSFSVVQTDEVEAPVNLGFAYSSTKRTISVSWDGDAAGYNAQYRPSASSDWYALPVSEKTATLTGVTYGSSYYFRVQSVAEDGALSEWTVDSYDTSTGGAIDSGARYDEMEIAFEEAFKDYFDDALL